MEQLRGHILVVDDNRVNRMTLSHSLQRQGHQVALAENGRQALDMIQAQPFDLMLLDIIMPEMDGYQVLDQVKGDSKLRDIPVIVISALDELDSVVRCIKMGAEDYLPKPFDPVLLKARIEASLEKKLLRDREVQYLRRINEELDLAWQIQSGFLPQALPSIPGWQLAATLKPSRETSGDFYDLIPLPDRHLGILVADVSGKGMGAALFMVLSRTLIRTYAAQHHSEPDAVLAAANRRILKDIHTDEFVTVFYGILNTTTGVLAYGNAGHNPPYLFNSLSGSSVQELDRTGIPLGLFADGSWEPKEVQLAPADTLILYSDGVTEAHDMQGELYGEERLQQIARANIGCSAQDMQDALMANLQEFMAAAPQFDDITLAVVIREQ